MKLGRWTISAILSLIICLACFGQASTSGPGAQNFSGGNGSSSSTPTNPVTAGIMGECSFTEGAGTISSCGTPGNATFGCSGGNSPTWVAASSGGGVSFVAGSTQCITYPPAFNTAQTIVLFITENTGTSGAPAAFGCIICGNGNGATGNNIDLLLSNQFNAVTTQAGAEQVLFESNNLFVGSMGSVFNGVGDVALVMTPSLNLAYINGIPITDYTSGSVAGTAPAMQGHQTVGAYQSGGTPAGSGLGSATFATYTLYRTIFYSTVKTPQEIQSIHNYLATLMATRGIIPQQASKDVGDEIEAVGDSITGGNGLTTPWTAFLFLNGNFNSTTVSNNGMQALTAFQMQQDGPITNPGNLQTDGFFRPYGSKNILHVWAGTNDIAVSTLTAAQTFLNLSSYIQARKKAGWNTFCATMISRTGSNGNGTFDSQKNTLNGLIRANWQAIGCAGLSDIASDPLLGADGASAGTGFVGDGIHPNQAAADNNISFIVQRNLNEYYGNVAASTANTYTTTTPAAVATTALTEATNTVTVTVAAGAPPAGSCAVIAGVTPSTYNSPATGSLPCWHILSSNGTTTFTYFNPTSGLGNATVQGTVLTPQELDSDVYAILGGSATTPSHVIQTCVGRIGQPIFRRITNTTSPWTITPIVSGETINGAATFTAPTATAANNQIVRLEAILTSASAGGCTWKASVQ